MQAPEDQEDHAQHGRRRRQAGHQGARGRDRAARDDRRPAPERPPRAQVDRRVQAPRGHAGRRLGDAARRAQLRVPRPPDVGRDPADPRLPRHEPALVRRPRQLLAGRARADHLPRDRLRLDRPDPRPRHHDHDQRAHRPRGVRAARRCSASRSPQEGRPEAPAAADRAAERRRRRSSREAAAEAGGRGRGRRAGDRGGASSSAAAEEAVEAGEPSRGRARGRGGEAERGCGRGGRRGRPRLPRSRSPAASPRLASSSEAERRGCGRRASTPSRPSRRGAEAPRRAVGATRSGADAEPSRSRARAEPERRRRGAGLHRRRGGLARARGRRRAKPTPRTGRVGRRRPPGGR